MKFNLPAYNEVSVTWTTAKGCGTWLTNETSCTRDTCTSGTSVSVQRQWKTLTTTTKSSCSYCWPGIVVCSERALTDTSERWKKEGELGRETRLSALSSLLSFFHGRASVNVLILEHIGFYVEEPMDSRTDCYVGRRISTSMIHIELCWMVNHSSLTKKKFRNVKWFQSDKKKHFNGLLTWIIVCPFQREEHHSTVRTINQQQATKHIY